jgi:glutathione S-transferase
MYYYPVAGRGELIRLIAATGGLDLAEGKPYGTIHKAEYGSLSGLPLLQHGAVKLSQSGAIERYVSGLVPRFAALTLAQQATDHMFSCIKEDVLLGCAKVIFGDVASAPTEVPKLCDKWFAVVEGLVPVDGFILGLDYPTVADLAVLNMARGYMPFGAAFKHGKYAFAPGHPKMAALVERTAAAPGVKEYLASSPSLNLSFLDIDNK